MQPNCGACQRYKKQLKYLLETSQSIFDAAYGLRQFVNECIKSGCVCLGQSVDPKAVFDKELWNMKSK